MSKFMKSLCKIAIPVTLQSMLQASFSIVDQIMIGQLGETNISAVGLCGNFSLIFSGGIVSFIIFLKVYVRFIKNSFEQKDCFLLSVIVTYLCYGIMESVFTNILLFPNLVIWILILQAKTVPHKKTFI